MLFCPLHASAATEPGRRRRLLLLLCVGGCPPAWPPAGACLERGTRLLAKPRHAVEGAPTPGLRLCPGTPATCGATGAMGRGRMDCGGARALLGQRPQAFHPRTGHGPRAPGGLGASCTAASGALPPPARGLPTAVREKGRLSRASPWARAPALGGSAVRPGACDPRPAGRGRSGVGPRPQLAPRPRGICRRQHAPAVPAGSWGSATGAGPKGRPPRAGPGAGHTAPSREGRNHGGPTPRWPGLGPCLGETLAACGGGGARAAVVWHDAGWRRGWTEPRRAPPALGRAPVRAAGRAALGAAPAGWEAPLGGLESAAGRCTGPREVPHGFRFPWGARDGRESAGAREARQVQRIPAGRVAPSPGLCGQEGGRPPSRRRLCAGAPARARSPRGPPQRPRGGGWLALASDGGVARGHPGVSRWGPERCPRHQTLGRQTPPPGKPCGHPGRSSVCETATGWPAALSVAVATAGGSGCGVSEPAVHWGATSRQRKSLCLGHLEKTGSLAKTAWTILFQRRQPACKKLDRVYTFVI